MKSNKIKIVTVIVLALAACIIFAVFALFVTSNYFITSGIKVLLFLSFPLAYFLLLDKKTLVPLFAKGGKKHMLQALLLGALAIIFIIAGFISFRSFFERETILAKILENNITPKTYPVVFVYIVFVNAFLEEFFFRGFVFLNLRRLWHTGFAQVISALIFSLYHVTIVIGAISIPVLVLMLAGLFAAGILFNEAARRCGNIWGALVIHVGANIALNSIVAYYFYFT